MLQSIVNGLTQGAIYALIALGYTMVYGILGMINFAHGEVYMVGGYLALITLVSLLTLGWGTGAFAVTGGLLIALVVSVTFCALYGAAIERVAYRPLRKAPLLSPLISAIGVSFFLWNFVAIFQGTTPKSFPDAFRGIAQTSCAQIGQTKITWAQVLIFVVSIGLMWALTWFVNNTRTGKAMRATQEDKTMAGLVGIDVNRVISKTFVIGSGLAAVAGLMVSLYLSQSFFRDGYLYGVKAFTAAVLGGIGNLPGAMLGGFVLGIVENVAIYYLADYGFGSDYKDVYTFVILLLILAVRPRGILGERVAEKV